MRYEKSNFTGDILSPRQVRLNRKVGRDYEDKVERILKRLIPDSKIEKGVKCGFGRSDYDFVVHYPVGYKDVSIGVEAKFQSQGYFRVESGRLFLMHDWMHESNPKKKVDLSYILGRYFKEMDYFIFVTNNIVELYEPRKEISDEKLVQQTYELHGGKKEAIFCNDSHLGEAVNRLENILAFKSLPILILPRGKHSPRGT